MSFLLCFQNSKQLPVRTPQETVLETAQLRLQFPVSSGTSHRAKEGEWVPVPKTTPSVICAPAAAPAIADVKVGVSSTPPAILPPPVPPPPPPPAAAPAPPVPPVDKVFADLPQKVLFSLLYLSAVT